MSGVFPPDVYHNIEDLRDALKNFGLKLKPEEAQSIHKRIGRVPTPAELFVFDIEWSEHCSYKSSKHLLKKYLPVDSPHVIQGPEEDAGIVYFTTLDGERYGIVFAHESHNHPSQVLPFEGAATGIGGIVRDVDCMGASLIGIADPLRFGDPNGKHGERTRSICRGVVEGIWHYGNALGIPNVGGDTVFHEGYDDNCLVNVVALGILKERDIIHSYVPKDGEGYDIILVGKPTDRSGFGGASFSSATLDQDAEEDNKGAVQIPDPFLKNVLLHYKANQQVRDRARELGLSIGMKDLGAGGIACCASEIASSGGFGVEINLENVHVEEENLPPEVILCAETQERFIWAVPPSFSEEVLKIYNEDWDLPTICSGAGARVIGKAIKEQVMRVHYQGEVVVDLPIEFVVEGIRYERESKEPVATFTEPSFDMPSDLNDVFIKMMSSPNMANKEWIHRHYDTEVLGISMLRPGEADAGVLTPLAGSRAGMALSVDGNPHYGEISPFDGAANAVAEAMRNVAAVGAQPRALTDCLNFGNPEVLEHFWQLENGIQGLADAAKNLYDPNDAEKSPIAFVSGNVSLYNHSTTGKSVPPSPIVACVGVIDDASHAVTMEIKSPGNKLLLVGDRLNELGGSEYYRTLELGLGANVPKVRYENERGIIYGTIEVVNAGLVLSTHDISHGGLLASAAEMLLAASPHQQTGLRIDLQSIPSDLRDDILLFSESSGMLIEASPDQVDAIQKQYKQYGLDAVVIGDTVPAQELVVLGKDGSNILKLDLNQLRQAWRGEFGLTLAS